MAGDLVGVGDVGNYFGLLARFIVRQVEPRKITAATASTKNMTANVAQTGAPNLTIRRATGCVLGENASLIQISAAKPKKTPPTANPKAANALNKPMEVTSGSVMGYTFIARAA